MFPVARSRSYVESGSHGIYHDFMGESAPNRYYAVGSYCRWGTLD